MKLKSQLVLFILCFCLLSLHSQNTYEKLPDDLDKEKIIFLSFDQIPITPDLKMNPKGIYKRRNKYAIIGNDQLKTFAEKYPFKYTIASRSECKELIEKGFRYALENDMMIDYNSGGTVFKTRNTAYISPMYILDLKTGDKYELFPIADAALYNYKAIIKKFIRIVNRKYIS